MNPVVSNKLIFPSVLEDMVINYLIPDPKDQETLFSSPECQQLLDGNALQAAFTTNTNDSIMPERHKILACFLNDMESTIGFLEWNRPISPDDIVVEQPDEKNNNVRVVRLIERTKAAIDNLAKNFAKLLCVKHDKVKNYIYDYIGRFGVVRRIGDQKKEEGNTRFYQVIERTIIVCENHLHHSIFSTFILKKLEAIEEGFNNTIIVKKERMEIANKEGKNYIDLLFEFYLSTIKVELFLLPNDPSSKLPRQKLEQIIDLMIGYVEDQVVKQRYVLLREMITKLIAILSTEFLMSSDLNFRKNLVEKTAFHFTLKVFLGLKKNDNIKSTYEIIRKLIPTTSQEKDKHEDSPLHSALKAFKHIRKGHGKEKYLIKIIEDLLFAGHSASSRNKAGDTPADLACELLLNAENPELKLVLNAVISKATADLEGGFSIIVYKV